jgi:hypothetical protein
MIDGFLEGPQMYVRYRCTNLARGGVQQRQGVIVAQDATQP